MADGTRTTSRESVSVDGGVMANADRVTEFVRLFTTYEVRLRAFAMTLLANHADVEDVLQQANLTLWAKFEEFEAGTNFMAWAARVLYLKVQQHRRRQSRDKLQFGEAYQDAILREASRAEFVAELGERERALAECMGRLRPEHREMLEARYHDENGMDKLERRFNRSREALYNTLSRVRRALYDCVTRTLREKYRHEPR
jgi:RNA polymerase sigma-70 factor (ECF subfamily)